MTPGIQRAILPIAFLLFAIAALGVLNGTHEAEAATITVDAVNAAGGCTLAEALDSALTNASVGGCTAGTAGTDTIVFSVGFMGLSGGSVTLASVPDINEASGDPIVIQGPANGPLVVNLSNDAFAVMTDISFVGLIVEGIGQVTVAQNQMINFTESIVRNSETGRIVSDGWITVVASTISEMGPSALTLTDTGFLFAVFGNFLDNAGPVIDNQGGEVDITQSSFDNNGGNSSPSYGGALRNVGGYVTIDKSIFYNNEARFGGGAIHNFAGSEANSRIDLENVTFSANEGGAGAAIYNEANGQPVVGFDAIVNLLNVTIALSNGDAIASNGKSATNGSEAIINAKMVLIALAVDEENCRTTGGGLIVSQGYNLSDDASCDDSFTQPTDQNDVPANIGSLTPTGGSSESLSALEIAGSAARTHPLGLESPALNGGTNIGCPISDQRLDARPQPGVPSAPAVCDIGAYERWSGDPVPVVRTRGSRLSRPVRPAATPTATPTPTQTPTVTPTWFLGQGQPNLGGLGPIIVVQNPPATPAPQTAAPAAADIAPATIRPPSTGDAGLK